MNWLDRGWLSGTYLIIINYIDRGSIERDLLLLAGQHITAHEVHLAPVVQPVLVVPVLPPLLSGAQSVHQTGVVLTVEVLHVGVLLEFVGVAHAGGEEHLGVDAVLLVEGHEVRLPHLLPQELS